MSPGNNYNWMPLSEALEIFGELTVVWWRRRWWDRFIGLRANELHVLQVLGLNDIMVCRALVPEVPSWEQSK